MDYTIVDELIDFFCSKGPFITKEEIAKSSFSDVVPYIDYSDYGEIDFPTFAKSVINSTRHYKTLVCEQDDVYENEVGDVLWAIVIAVEDLATSCQITRWGSFMDIWGRK